MRKRKVIDDYIEDGWLIDEKATMKRKDTNVVYKSGDVRLLYDRQKDRLISCYILKRNHMVASYYLAGDGDNES